MSDEWRSRVSIRVAPSPIRPSLPQSSALLPLWAGLSLDALPVLMLILTKQWEGHHHPASSSCLPFPIIGIHQSKSLPFFLPLHFNLKGLVVVLFVFLLLLKEDHFGLAQQFCDALCGHLALLLEVESFSQQPFSVPNYEALMCH